MSEKEFLEHCLTKIDLKQPLTEREISDLLEWEVMKDEGEDRRWSRSITSLIEINGRYFTIDWEHGLTENQDNSYMNQPIEVFNPKFAVYTTYETRVYDREGNFKDSFDGLLNDVIEEDKT